MKEYFILLVTYPTWSPISQIWWT